MSARENDIVRVFVYGTLKMGFPLFFHEGLMANRVEAFPARIRGELYDLGLFPALRLNSDDAVAGEVHVFKNPEETLEILDEMEGYFGPGQVNNYNRREVDAVSAERERITCFTYEYAEDLPKEYKIEDGRWPPG